MMMKVTQLLLVFLSIGFVEAFYASNPRSIPKSLASYRKGRHLPTLHANTNDFADHDESFHDALSNDLDNYISSEDIARLEGKDELRVSAKSLIDEIDGRSKGKGLENVATALSVFTKIGPILTWSSTLVVGGSVASGVLTAGAALVPLAFGALVFAILKFSEWYQGTDKEDAEEMTKTFYATQAKIEALIEWVEKARDYKNVGSEEGVLKVGEKLYDFDNDLLPERMELREKIMRGVSKNMNSSKKFAKKKKEGIRVARYIFFYVRLTLTWLWALGQIEQIMRPIEQISVNRKNIYLRLAIRVLKNDRELIEGIIGMPYLPQHKNSIYSGIHQLPLDQLLLIESYANLSGVYTGRLVSIQDEAQRDKNNDSGYWTDYYGALGGGVAVTELPGDVDLRKRFRFFEEEVEKEGKRIRSSATPGKLFCCCQGGYIQPDINLPNEKMWPLISSTAKEYKGGWNIPKKGNCDGEKISYQPTSGGSASFAYVSEKKMNKGYIRLNPEKKEGASFVVTDLKV